MRSKILTGLLCSVGVLGLAVSMNQEDALAHGYVKSPASRGYQGHLDKNSNYNDAFNKYGGVINDPQSLEAPKGFPEVGPADTKIASANGQFGGTLDNQAASMWKKTDIKQGKNVFTWNFTASHKTSKWHYYMTKPGWNQNEKLTRDSLQLIGTVEHGGADASDKTAHEINVPTDRTGYHVILAVWDVADTANAFYNVIDVNVAGDTSLPEVPNAPEKVQVMSVTDNSVTLGWERQPNVSSYNIYRDGKKVGNSTSDKFEDTNLSAETQYSYTVEAISVSGLTSTHSTAVTATTNSVEGEIEKNPTAPENLHSMGKTETTVSLMWKGSTHSTGIKEYQILRDGKQIATTEKTTYEDTNLTANTEYNYTIKAVATSGLVSENSNILTIRTAEEEGTETPEVPETPEGVRVWKLGTFSNPEYYAVNEEVAHKGKLYKVIQAHNNYGDATWSPDQADTLFTYVSDIEQKAPLLSAGVRGNVPHVYLNLTTQQFSEARRLIVYVDGQYTMETYQGKNYYSQKATVADKIQVRKSIAGRKGQKLQVFEAPGKPGQSSKGSVLVETLELANDLN